MVQWNNNMYVNGELPGAYKNGYRWMIPMEVVSERIINETKKVRTFNTTGVCNPEQHYMVDLGERLAQVRILVKESNSLFDDMAKKVKDYLELKSLLYDILFCGRSIPYNLGTELVSIGTMFGFLKDDAGQKKNN